jgi:transposase InsO family protein
MPWKEADKMSLRRKFILELFNNAGTFTELCTKYGITTKTGYKWKERFMEGGFPALEEKSRKPASNSKGVPEAVVVELIRIKNLHKNWGASKILKVYKNNHPGEYAPARSTVENLLERSGFVVKRKRKRNKTTERIQIKVVPDHPNQVWTVDFKGWWYTKHREKCEPLTVRDEYSKYILDIRVLEKGDIPHVKQAFEMLFTQYGLPEVIRSDNGVPFASHFNVFGLSKLAVWWMSLGIKLDRIDPGCPYQNGGHERMHRDMKAELEGQIDGNLNEHQRVFDKWREDFNAIRPHEALGMKTPSDVYVKSERKYDPEDVLIVYGKGYKSRMVNDRGFCNYRGKRLFVGNPFAGYNVGVKENKDDIEIWFDDFLIGVLDKITGLIIYEKDSIKVHKAQ